MSYIGRGECHSGTGLETQQGTELLFKPQTYMFKVDKVEKIRVNHSFLKTKNTNVTLFKLSTYSVIGLNQTVRWPF